MKTTSFSEIEDNLKYVLKGRQTQFVLKWKLISNFGKRKMTWIFLLMEDDVQNVKNLKLFVMQS